MQKACQPEAEEGGSQAELPGQGVPGRGASSANGLRPGRVGAFRDPVVATGRVWRRPGGDPELAASLE